MLVQPAPTLIRVGALAGIAGGVLRMAASFAPVVIASDLRREVLYVTIDTCLATGLIAFYSQRSKPLERWGTGGLVLALVGIATIRGNRLVSSADLYSVGALAIGCGVIMLTANAWRVTQIQGWVPAVFILSTLLGIGGTGGRNANALFVCSGLLFGIAFTGLGLETWVSASRPRTDLTETAPRE
jgi:hypothetical protein